MPAHRTRPDEAVAVAEALALTQGGVLSAQQALACGLTEEQVRTLLRQREWSALRRGAYAVQPERSATAAEVVALLLRRSGGDPPDLSRSARLVAGRETAALLHELPLIVPERLVLLDRRVTPLPEDHVVRRHGVPATSVARTVADLARTHGRLQGVVAADAALRRGATPEQLREAAAHGAGWRGATAAHDAAALARRLSESPLESIGRLRLVDAGFPEPELQVEVHDARGLIGRTDHLWRAQRVVGEADGLAKYDDPGALAAEKVREDRLRGVPLEVFRYTWAIAVHDQDELVRRAREAFARAEGWRS